MRKALAIILASVFAAAFLNSAMAETWNVPSDFLTIQDAINGSNAGDTIRVGPGNHAGAIVNKAIEIKGEEGATINSGPLLSSYQPCGTIILNIGFFFEGGGAGSGATISHFNFENLAFPVFSRGADDVTVSQNTMINPIQGITDWNGSRWEITHNDIIDLRTANGGGIGILVGGNAGGIYEENIISHNKISGTLHVASCDSGGYDGTGAVLYADWRYGRSGAIAIRYNRVVKNKVGLVSDNPETVDVWALELSEAENPGQVVICDNAVGFNDLLETVSQIALTPDELEDCNSLSRNLGNNRGQGAHPSAFVGSNGDEN